MIISNHPPGCSTTDNASTDRGGNGAGSLSTRQLNGPRRYFHFVLFATLAAVPWTIQRTFSRIPLPATAVKSAEATIATQFVPFPHNNLAYGNDVFCDWKTFSMNDPTVSSLLGSQNAPPDKIQKAALRESICIPRNETLLSKLHLFSTEQARACLSNVTLLVTGDSYNIQLFIGLAEIIIGVASNNEIDGSYKRRQVQDEILKGVQQGVGGVDVWFGCKMECYGDLKPFWKQCSDCIKEFRSKGDKIVVPVVGSAVHIRHAVGNRIDRTVEQFQLFVNATENVIFNSPPSYQISKVPAAYQNDSNGRSSYYWDFLPHVENYDFRFLDFFQLTRSCTMENCSADGGHRARFVNRWKAQLLLNTLCS